MPHMAEHRSRGRTVRFWVAPNGNRSGSISSPVPRDGNRSRSKPKSNSRRSCGEANRRPLPKSSAPLCSSGAHPNASAALSWASRAEKYNEKLRRKRISEEAGGGGAGAFQLTSRKIPKGLLVSSSFLQKSFS